MTLEFAATLQAIGAVVQGGAAVILMVMTGRYVRLTRELAEQSAAQLVRLYKSEIVAQLEPRGPMVIDYVVTCLGPSSARDVELTLKFGDASSQWNYRVLRPGQVERFRLPGPNARNVTQLRSATAPLVVRLQYRDGNGDVIQEADEIDCAATLTAWADQGWLQIDSELHGLTKAVSEGLKKVEAALQERN